MRLCVPVLAIAISWRIAQTEAFAPPICCAHKKPRNHSGKLMAGFGAVGAAKTKTKKNKKKSGSKQTSFDINASICRLEKKYDELMLASAKQMAKETDEDPRWASDVVEDTITSEFTVAARSSKKNGINDWIPIAQMCISYPERNYDPENNKVILEAAVSCYCREIGQVATLGAPMFSSIARNDMNYSVEPVDSFHKHVYDCVVEESSSKSMSKRTARVVLGLDEKTVDRTAIKQAYRKLSFQLHPDRLDKAEKEKGEDGTIRFETVQLAYETLTSGIRQDNVSWYESLGGRARTDFHRVTLLSLADAERKIEQMAVKAAIIGLDPELVQGFVARNLRSE